MWAQAPPIPRRNGEWLPGLQEDFTLAGPFLNPKTRSRGALAPCADRKKPGPNKSPGGIFGRSNGLPGGRLTTRFAPDHFTSGGSAAIP